MSSYEDKLLFKDEQDYKFFYKFFKQSFKREGIKILHYCFLPDQIDVVCKKFRNSDLGRLTKSLALSYFVYYKQKYDDPSRLWGERYKSLLIENEFYSLLAGIVIERKPEVFDTYRFSSYRYYAYGIKDMAVKKNSYYKKFGEKELEKQELYRNVFVDPFVVNQRYLKALRYLGSDEFIEKMEKRFRVKNTKVSRIKDVELNKAFE